MHVVSDPGKTMLRLSSKESKSGNGAVCNRFLRVISLPTVASFETIALIGSFLSVAMRFQKQMVVSMNLYKLFLLQVVDSGEVPAMSDDLSPGWFRFVLRMFAIVVGLVRIDLPILIPAPAAVRRLILVGLLPPLL